MDALSNQRKLSRKGMKAKIAELTRHMNDLQELSDTCSIAVQEQVKHLGEVFQYLNIKTEKLDDSEAKKFLYGEGSIHLTQGQDMAEKISCLLEGDEGNRRAENTASLIWVELDLLDAVDIPYYAGLNGVGKS